MSSEFHCLVTSRIARDLPERLRGSLSCVQEILGVFVIKRIVTIVVFDLKHRLDGRVGIDYDIGFDILFLEYSKLIVMLVTVLQLCRTQCVEIVDLCNVNNNKSSRF